MSKSLELRAGQIYTDEQYNVYRAGHAAFDNGAPNSANPFAGKLRSEWARGYRMARQRIRFAETMKAKRAISPRISSSPTGSV